MGTNSEIATGKYCTITSDKLLAASVQGLRVPITNATKIGVIKNNLNLIHDALWGSHTTKIFLVG